MLVHEFCKLLSKNGVKHGIPEYAHGAVAFPDFLALMASQSSSSEAKEASWQPIFYDGIQCRKNISEGSSYKFFEIY